METGLNDDYGQPIKTGDIDKLRKHFEHKATVTSEAAAAKEVFDLRWCPTDVPVYNVILMFLYMQPQQRAKYLGLAKSSSPKPMLLWMERICLGQRLSCTLLARSRIQILSMRRCF